MFSVADLRGHEGPPGSKFFQFHAVFGKIWQNGMLVPLKSWCPHLGEILDLPQVLMSTECKQMGAILLSLAVGFG